MDASNKLLQVLSLLEQYRYTAPYDLQADAVMVFVHAPGEFETLFGHAETSEIIQLLHNQGFQQVKRIDCRERIKDAYDQIVYHFRLPLEIAETPFYSDWSSEECRFSRFQVLQKYGIEI